MVPAGEPGLVLRAAARRLPPPRGRPRGRRALPRPGRSGADPPLHRSSEPAAPLVHSRGDRKRLSAGRGRERPRSHRRWRPRSQRRRRRASERLDRVSRAGAPPHEPRDPRRGGSRSRGDRRRTGGWRDAHVRRAAACRTRCSQRRRVRQPSDLDALGHRTSGGADLARNQRGRRCPRRGRPPGRAADLHRGLRGRSRETDGGDAACTDDVDRRRTRQRGSRRGCTYSRPHSPRAR